MADPALSPTLARMLQAINRRLDKIERSASMPWSSLRGGAMKFQDTSGQDRLVMGNLELDSLTGTLEFNAQTDYGVFLFGDESLAMWVREGARGLVYPPQPISFAPMHASADNFGPFFSHQNTTFSRGFIAQLLAPVSDMLFVDINLETSVGTTAEVRLFEFFSATATTPVALPSDFDGNVRFRWVHPSSSGLYDGRGRDSDCAFYVESRVTGGDGVVRMRHPHFAMICSTALFDVSYHPASTDGAGAILDGTGRPVT